MQHQTPNVGSSSESRAAPRVLIVEDDPTTAIFARNLCTAQGAEAWCAADGREAIEMFEQSAFDLVLMDLELPSMGGFEITYELRAIERERFRDQIAVIIAVTGSPSPEFQRKCLQTGMQRCVGKPYTVELVQSLLASIGYQSTLEEPALSSGQGA